MKSSADFLTKTLQARKECHHIFKVMKGKHLQQRRVYPARLSLRLEEEIKSITRQAKAKRIRQN